MTKRTDAPSPEMAAQAACDMHEQRQARLLSVTFTNACLGDFSAIVRNISARGLGGRTDAALKVGERVFITITDHPQLTGTVCWRKSDRFGLRTDKTIEVNTLKGAGGARLETIDDRGGKFEPLKHDVESTYRPTLSFGGRSSEETASDWRGN